MEGANTKNVKQTRALLEEGLDALARAKEDIAQVEQVIGTLLHNIERNDASRLGN